ncbi:MAG: uroporphyrinogen-III synthase [bacterium]|nr:uroporphyrinogen-III synthase [bacterium]
MSPGSGRIAVLREPERAESLRAALAEAGFDVIVHPVTRVELLGPAEGDDWETWAEAADWVVFTSLNGVAGFSAGVGGDARLAELLRRPLVAVLGAMSARKLDSIGVTSDVREERGTSVELAAAMVVAVASSSTVLYPCAAQTMPTLPRVLREAGHRLRQVVCYDTQPLAPAERQPLDWGSLAGAVVAAPSAVRALEDEPGLPAGFGFFAIGPTTAAALRAAGLKVLGVAESPTAPAIVRMVCATV